MARVSDVSSSTSSPGVLASAGKFMHAGGVGASTSALPRASQRHMRGMRESAPASSRVVLDKFFFSPAIRETLDNELDSQTRTGDDRFPIMTPGSAVIVSFQSVMFYL